MSKTEFLDTLGRRLAQILPAEKVQEHVDYYDRYIREQVAGGKTERQVLDELGDPLLIARSITAAALAEEEASDREAQAVYQEPEDFGDERDYRYRYIRPYTIHISSRTGCLIIAILLVLIAALILWLVGSVLSLVLPVLVPVLLVAWLLGWLKNRR